MTNYSNFVEHPRYGRGPRYTRLQLKGRVEIGWHADGLISGTAVRANLNKQVSSTVPVTHYFDLVRRCRDCSRMFIFFAKEQQYWYEELQFGLDSDCVRCVPCRKQRQGSSRLRQQYQELFEVPQRTPDQSLTMAECCLALIENGTFTTKQIQRVRTLLNSVSDKDLEQERVAMIRERIARLEQAT